MEEKNYPANSSHKLSLTGRNKGNFTGIKDVISFDNDQVMMLTELGKLSISGKELHVSRLNLDKGEVDLEGSVSKIEYQDMKPTVEESLFQRLFR
ncbi:MAG: sporulation protein YabP [Lachnospiraceae bacterium]|nr:sporulation protein YabP [Lachnospiraceae bacterium]